MRFQILCSLERWIRTWLDCLLCVYAYEKAVKSLYHSLVGARGRKRLTKTLYCYTIALDTKVLWWVWWLHVYVYDSDLLDVTCSFGSEMYHMFHDTPPSATSTVVTTGSITDCQLHGNTYTMKHVKIKTNRFEMNMYSVTKGIHIPYFL